MIMIRPNSSTNPSPNSNSNSNKSEDDIDCELYESLGELNDNDIDSGILSSNNKMKDHLLNRRWGSYRLPGGKKQIGSNALARSSSFNSSGHGSTTDTVDDMYSDISLEEDVVDLNNKVQILQNQVGVLTDNANDTDEKYLRAKNENSSLRTQILILEEQIRDNELKSEETLKREEKKYRELISRMERDKKLLLENHENRLKEKDREIDAINDDLVHWKNKYSQLDQESFNLTTEILNLKQDVKEVDNQKMQLILSEKKTMAENEKLKEVIQELHSELEQLHTNKVLSNESNTIKRSQINDLELEIEHLSNENRQLKESNKTLESTLLNSCKMLTNETSLASELELLDNDNDNDKYHKLQQTLKDQQFVNSQLKNYIDYILLMIVEKSPQLLEIKRDN